MLTARRTPGRELNHKNETRRSLSEIPFSTLSGWMGSMQSTSMYIAGYQCYRMLTKWAALSQFLFARWRSCMTQLPASTTSGSRRSSRDMKLKRRDSKLKASKWHRCSCSMALPLRVSTPFSRTTSHLTTFPSSSRSQAGTREACLVRESTYRRCLPSLSCMEMVSSSAKLFSPWH